MALQYGQVLHYVPDLLLGALVALWIAGLAFLGGLAIGLLGAAALSWGGWPLRVRTRPSVGLLGPGPDAGEKTVAKGTGGRGQEKGTNDADGAGAGARAGDGARDGAGAGEGAGAGFEAGAGAGSWPVAISRRRARGSNQWRLAIATPETAQRCRS